MHVRFDRARALHGSGAASRAEPALKPAKPYAEISVDPDWQKKSVGELVEEFAKLKSPVADCWSNVGVRFVLAPDPDKMRNQDGKIPPAFWEAVRRGVASLPVLLKHLDDARKSGIVEADYTLTVGDVCYSAIGQIVGESYHVIHFTGIFGTILNSPTSDSGIVGNVRSQWERLSPAEHEKELRDTASTPNSTYPVEQRNPCASIIQRRAKTLW